MKNSVSVSYKTVNLVIALVWVASMSAMEPRDDLVTSQGIKDLSKSIMQAEGSDDSSRSWIATWSDWWHGLDTNVVSELQQGTLTKEAVAQDKVLQARAYAAIDTAITKNRTENLCVLLQQLKSFDMLNLDQKQHESITQFLNKEITNTCQQKVAVKLIAILNAMKTAELPVHNDSLDAVNGVLNEQKELDVQIFKNILQNTQVAMVKLQEQMMKDREHYKGPLLQAHEILLLQKYLAGEEVVSEKNQEKIKQELAIDAESKDIGTLYKAVKTFSEKSFVEKK